MNRTKIEWTEVSWNPITGCTPISEGCQNCYAARMAKRLAGRYGYPADDPFRPRFHSDRLHEPYRWKSPKMIFVCSMGDLFHEDVPFDVVARIFDVIAQAMQHTYLILTKRPGVMARCVRKLENRRIARFDDMFPNVWLGVTVENQDAANERIPAILGTPAAVRFVSAEPMLGPVSLWRIRQDRWTIYNALEGCGDTSRGVGGQMSPSVFGNKLDWVIIGCESGPGRRPMKLGWAVDLVHQCQAVGVPVFVKQIEIDGKVSHDPAEWPPELRVREYPYVRA